MQIAILNYQYIVVVAFEFFFYLEFSQISSQSNY